MDSRICCFAVSINAKALTNKLNILGPGPFPFLGFVWRDGGKLVDRGTPRVWCFDSVGFAQKRLAFNRVPPLSSSLSLSLSLSLSIYIDICIIYNIYYVQDRSSSV